MWHEVSELLQNPEKLEQEYQDRRRGSASTGNLETLKAQLVKLEHARERLIDSFTEGLIDKDQFMSRMGRTKSRIADLDAKIKADAGDVDASESLRLAANRIRELTAAIGPDLASADWYRRREIIRTVVQRIDIGPEAIQITFRIIQDRRGSGSESIAVTLPRP